MITITLAYLFLAGYLVVERRLRKGAQAKSWSAGKSDGHSTKLVVSSMYLHAVFLVAATFLQKNSDASSFSNWMGVIVMACGLALRYWAALTLGKYYSRMLMIQEGQSLITNKLPYSLIRHPGYLGLLALEIGSALAVGMDTSWLVVDFGLGCATRHYRMGVEEQMLIQQFEEKYKSYCRNTWRMVPFIY